MIKKILSLVFLVVLSGCQTPHQKSTLHVPETLANPSQLIAFYEIMESGESLKGGNNSRIQLAFAEQEQNWFDWAQYVGRFNLSALKNQSLSFTSSFKGEAMANLISSVDHNYDFSLGRLPLTQILKGSKQLSLPSDKNNFIYQGLSHSPILLSTNFIPSAQPLWEKATPQKRIVEKCLPAFKAFIENGLIEKGSVLYEDLDILDYVQLKNGAIVTTLGVTALTNKDDQPKEKRYKSFYIPVTGDPIDINAVDGVRFEGSSTGVDSHFLDALESNGKMLLFFWIWEGTRTGYRLYDIAKNGKIDFYR